MDVEATIVNKISKSSQLVLLLLSITLNTHNTVGTTRNIYKKGNKQELSFIVQGFLHRETNAHSLPAVVCHRRSPALCGTTFSLAETYISKQIGNLILLGLGFLFLVRRRPAQT